MDASISVPIVDGRGRTRGTFVVSNNHLTSPANRGAVFFTAPPRDDSAPSEAERAAMDVFDQFAPWTADRIRLARVREELADQATPAVSRIGIEIRAAARAAENRAIARAAIARYRATADAPRLRTIGPVAYAPAQTPAAPLSPRNVLAHPLQAATDFLARALPSHAYGDVQRLTVGVITEYLRTPVGDSEDDEASGARLPR